MKWLAILLTFSLAYGQDLPTQVAGTPEVACPEPDETVTCFELGGTLPEAEARIRANAQDLGLGSIEWFDTMGELFEGWNVTEPEVEDARYTAFGTDKEWFLVMAFGEYGVMIVNLTESWASQP